MTNYRRSKIAGASYFFTVKIAQGSDKSVLINNIELLRHVFCKVRTKHPFKVDAIVILPDHIHCIWTLPDNDADYQTRWMLIKSDFSRQIPRFETRSLSHIKRRERGIWQRLYWEHQIRDENDLQKHIDYIHWNPVKHGWVSKVSDWPYSSFHKYVKNGLLPGNWAGVSDDNTSDWGE